MYEEWRPVEGWEGYYEVSNLGRVRSLDRIVPGGIHAPYEVRGGLLTVSPSQNGYGQVHLRKGKTFRKMERVHRLVAGAFITNPDKKPNVNHIDCNINNNRCDNLEWCTQAENLQHMGAMGRRAPNFWKGKRSPNARLSDAEANDIRIKYASGSYSYSALADAFCTNKRTIGRIVNGEVYV